MSAVIESKTEPAVTGRLDRAAIGISILCLAQCLLLPVLIIVTPLMSAGFLGEEAFHWLLLAVILPVSLAAFWLGYRRHRNARMWLPGLGGLGVLVVAALLGHDLLGDWGTALLTSAGGLLLILGHFLNLRAAPCSAAPQGR